MSVVTEDSDGNEIFAQVGETFSDPSSPGGNVSILKCVLAPLGSGLLVRSRAGHINGHPRVFAALILVLPASITLVRSSVGERGVEERRHLVEPRSF